MVLTIGISEKNSKAKTVYMLRTLKKYHSDARNICFTSKDFDSVEI
jgi:hypothetical protein